MVIESLRNVHFHTFKSFPSPLNLSVFIVIQQQCYMWNNNEVSSSSVVDEVDTCNMVDLIIGRFF